MDDIKLQVNFEKATFISITYRRKTMWLAWASISITTMHAHNIHAYRTIHKVTNRNQYTRAESRDFNLYQIHSYLKWKIRFSFSFLLINQLIMNPTNLLCLFPRKFKRDRLPTVWFVWHVHARFPIQSKPPIWNVCNCFLLQLDLIYIEKKTLIFGP